jgi:hypothetical protein
MGFHFKALQKMLRRRIYMYAWLGRLNGYPGAKNKAMLRLRAREVIIPYAYEGVQSWACYRRYRRVPGRSCLQSQP